MQKREYGNFLSTPIHIQTFGNLKLFLQGKPVLDNEWSGRRVKLLLKTLIALGGMKVSMETLGDLLCPDADGDRAQANLKTMLSRLRRVCRDPDNNLIPWIQVKHKRISLKRSFSVIDSIYFQETIESAYKTKNYCLLRKGLDLYTDDFLGNDTEPWFAPQRELLRKKFISGVKIYSEHCLEMEKIEGVLPYLHKGIEKDPLDEYLYALLMTLFLKTGYPSQALQVYGRAKKILISELRIQPGPRLNDLARMARLSD